MGFLVILNPQDFLLPNYVVRACKSVERSDVLTIQENCKI